MHTLDVRFHFPAEMTWVDFARLFREMRKLAVSHNAVIALGSQRRTKKRQARKGNAP